MYTCVHFYYVGKVFIESLYTYKFINKVCILCSEKKKILLDQPDLLYDHVTHLLDEGKAVVVVYLDFSKAFDTVLHSILLEKLAAHGLDGCMLRWIKNWLNG